MENRMQAAITTLTLTMALIPNMIFGQPNVSFLRVFENEGHDSFHDVYSVSDGGFVACGATEGYAMGLQGFYYVVRTDQDGNEIWSYVMDDADHSIALSIVEADNGDFVVGGRHNVQFNATRLSPEGELIWTNDYIGGTCEALIELKDGNFLLCGISGNGRIILIDGDGNQIWSRGYDAGRSSHLFSLRETDEGAIAVGYGQYLIWAIKVEIEDGDIIWSNSYRLGNSLDIAFSLVSTFDGGYALSGWASGRTFLMKINSDGGMVWNEIYIYDFAMEMRGMCRSPDGGFVIVGQSWPINGQHRPYCLRTDSRGHVRWIADYDFRGHEVLNLEGQFRSVVFNRDGEIIAAGHANNRALRNSDAILMKLEPDFPDHRNITIMPEDTVVTVLLNDTVEFSVTLNGEWGYAPMYEWFFGDSLIGEADLQEITFNEEGEYLVECRFHFDELTISIRWHVTVTDLFIAAHSPDTLDLTLRRGSTVDFSIDSVAAVEGDDVQYQWLRNDLDRQEESGSGEDAGVTLDFNRSGHYTVEGMAYRGESHDEVVWDVEVRGAIWSFLPEELNVVSLEGDNVEFQIIPTISDSLNWYTWLYDGGMIREGWDSVFVMNFFELGEHTITGVLADSVESDSVSWTVLVESNSVPPSLSLEPSAVSLSASPNPFNSMLMIRFSTGSQAAPTRLAVYDLSGREVARLIDSKSEIRNLKSEITWNASSVPAGVYLVRLQQDEQISTRKVVLLK